MAKLRKIIYDKSQTRPSVHSAMDPGIYRVSAVAIEIVADLACGRGAPVCVTIAAFAGGALAAFGAGFIWRGKLVRSLSTSELAARLASPYTDTVLARSELLPGGSA